MSTEGLDRLKALSENLLEPEIFLQVIEKLPDALVMIKQDGSIVVFNEAAAFLFGYHPSEVIGRSVNILLPNSKQSAHAGHLSSFFAAPRSRPMGTGLELTGQRKDGSVFPVEINLSPLVSPSGFYAMAVIRRVGNDR